MATNADIAVRRTTGTDARMVQTEFTSTGTTRSIANGAAAEALRSALAELESGEELSDFVEGHGLQSRYFAFSWRSDWLSISYRLPYARVLSGEEAASLDNARIGAAIRMALLLLASDSGEALLHDGETALSVEAGEFGVRYDITGPDGEEIDSADDWQPLIARLENDLPSAGESLHIIWP